MSSVDYTPVLLAQLTDLQMRVTKQEALITALTSEVEKLSGKKVVSGDISIMRTSVPLRSAPLRPTAQDYKPRDTRDTRDNRDYRPTREHPMRTYESRTSDQRISDPRDRRSKPKVADASRPTMSLSDVLHKDEEVTILVHTGKDEDGNFIDTTALATFDGTDLRVTECEQVASLVGMKSSKPGEILYKFIDELKSSGHIKRTFTIAPWKLCFVNRGGVKQSLEDLRTVVG